MDFSQQIKKYYFENFDKLDKPHQFHFASRIAAWQADPAAQSKLAGMEAYICGDGNIKALLADILASPVRQNIFGRRLRQPFFDKYPLLFGFHDALFRLRHLRVIYGIDARSQLLELISADDLENLYSQLAHDQPALRILSRFAIDYLLLYEILFDRKQRLEPHKLLELANGYSLVDDTQLHLLIYLLTHTIIADSFFYARPVPPARLDIYRQMLSRVEELLIQNPEAKLDCQYEFLVACRICGRDSPLFSKLQEAALTHLSPRGTFITDPKNGGPEAGLNGFGRSEHRNVLFIMSQSPYRFIR